MPLFSKFNKVAVAAKARIQTQWELLPMRLHKIEDASFETTAKGEAVNRQAGGDQLSFISSIFCIIGFYFDQSGLAAAAVYNDRQPVRSSTTR